MLAHYNSIAEVAGVKLINYWNHSVVQDSTYFYNSTHLNKNGANIISDRLAHDLDSLNLIEQ